MSHDLSSAHFAAGAAIHPLSSEQQGGGRSRSSSHSIASGGQNIIDDNHQPGVSPPLGPGQNEQIDLEGNNLPPLSMLNMPPVARLPASEKLHKATSTSTSIDAAISNHPLHVDTTTAHIPAAGPVPNARLSPDGVSFSQSHHNAWLTPATEEADPLLLRSRVVDTDQELRRRPSHNRKANKKVKKYYERQNELIENLLKPIAKHASEGDDEAEQAGRMVKVLIYVNIFANFGLAALQLYAAISSLSLSFFATAADSVFDPFANVFLNWLHLKSKKLDKNKWPVGGARITNAGNITYAAIMGSVSVVLIVESARDLATHKATDVETFHVAAVVAVGVALITKTILAILNYSYRKHSSQLDMLWEDCRNDMVICSFGLFTSAAGSKIAWFIDPMGAMIIAFVIIGAWSLTAYKQFMELCGKAAPIEFIQLCTYNALHIHYDKIQAIESIIAYHSGPKYIVEVDIVMQPETSLWKSHDVSQDLQDRIEQLPMVERAYIHVDWEVHHPFEHSAKKNK